MLELFDLIDFWYLEFMILKKSVNGYAKGKGKNMDFKFCPFCGRRLQTTANGNKKRLYCDPCAWTHYRNPTVGVAVVLLKNDELLLVKRNGSYEGMWCIPCGHVEYDEDIRIAAKREFKEETGLDVDVGPVFAVHSNFHDLEHQTVGIWFLGTCTGGKLEAGSDASKAKFFPPDELPKEMAFPTDLLVCEQIKSLIKDKKGKP